MIREEEPPRPSARISTLGAAATTISAHRKTDPVKLSQLLHRDLDWIVMKAIQKDRTRRYQTASDFARDIERYLADEPVEARPPSLADRAAKWARRHRPLVASAAVLLVLSTIGLAASTLLVAYERSRTEKAYNETEAAYQAKDQQLTATQKAERLAREQEGLAKQQEEAAQKQAALAREQRQLAIAQEKQAAQQRDTAQRNLYLADMRLAMEDWKAGQSGRLQDTLDSHVPQSGQADLRGWEWYYLLSLCHGEMLKLPGHEYRVPHIAWSPNGEQLASTSDGCDVKIWDARTGRVIRRLTGAIGVVTSVVWSPDGRVLASGSTNKIVTLWDAATGRILGTLRGHNGVVTCVAWSPDGLLLGTICDDETVGVWDVAKAEKIRFLPVGERHTSLAWHADGRHLAVAGGRDGVAIWDATTGKAIRTLPGHGLPISSLAWSPDRRRLAAGAVGAVPDGSFEVEIWDATTGKEVLSLKGLDGSVNKVAWSPDGRQLATAGYSSTVRISDATTGEEIRTFRGHTDGVGALAWSPDGKRLASGSSDGTIRIWDAARDPETRILHSQDTIFAVAWSPDGRNLATSGGENVAVWDMATGNVTRLLGGHVGGSYGLAWSPDGKYLASGDAHGTVAIWEAGTGRRLHELKGHSGVIWALAWEPDGHRLASGGDGKTIKLWDVGTWKSIQPLGGDPRGKFVGLAWSPNGQFLASTVHTSWGSRYFAHVWDLATGKQLSFHANLSCGHGGVAWSPDGRWLALMDARSCRINVLNATDRESGFCLAGHTGVVFSVAWRPEGNRLVSAAEDHTIKIWDTVARQEVMTMYGHTAAGSSALAWSPNGRCLAAPNGKDVKIWDASIGYKLAASEYRFDYARRLQAQGRRDEARVIYERLAADHPDVPEYQFRAGDALSGQAWDVNHEGKLEEARKLYERAIAHSRTALKGDPDDLRYLVQLACDLASLGEVLKAMERLDEAMTAYRSALEIAERMPDNAERSRRLMVSRYCYEVAELLKRRGQLTEAEVFCRRSLDAYNVPGTGGSPQDQEPDQRGAGVRPSGSYLRRRQEVFRVGARRSTGCRNRDSASRQMAR